MDSGLAKNSRTRRAASTSSQSLVMVSDGIDEDQALRSCLDGREETPQELSRRLLAVSRQEGDDATVVVIRLLPVQGE